MKKKEQSPTRSESTRHDGRADNDTNTDTNPLDDKEFAKLELDELLEERRERYRRIFFDFLLISIVVSSLFIGTILIWENGIDRAVNARMKSLTNSGLIQWVKPK